MKQVFMRKNPLGRANVVTDDVPVPRCAPGAVLIANRCSLISAGTESAAVKRNMKDMVVKAATDPELRESVKQMVFKDGVAKTAARVHYETTKWTPMGYSGVGIAVEVGQDVEGISEGDMVAYGGEGHAEYIRVAKNLCVSVPAGVTAQQAAFVAMGSIALQAVRRANVQVGDIVAVLGLGLVGQLVSQMLQAAGARVWGSDQIPERIELARSLGLERGYVANDRLPNEILRHTEGVGVDRVVICASTSSSQVIEQAVAMARDRARITVVGMVNLEVPCEDFYSKELDLVTSRSYGPGRYDPQYEQHGIDYPVGYVRWTEKRNMQEFLRLVHEKKVNVDALVSHEFEVDKAAAAYATLIDEPQKGLAVLLRYPGENGEDRKTPRPQRTVEVQPGTEQEAKTTARKGVAVVGCGAFARQFHLPNLKSSSELYLRYMVASSGQSAKEMGVRYGAEECTTELSQALDDPRVNAVMVFTRDNNHASMVLAAAAAGKHVFCEKPLATSYEQCQEIGRALGQVSTLCMVGFNRRFAPLAVQAKSAIDDCQGPRTLLYRVNAGQLPKGDWVYDSKYAAGRIVGEVCHFVDLASWLIGSEPTAVFAQPIGPCSSINALENVSATFQFSDGSAATITYTSLGASSFSKERVEVFADATAVVLDDFERLTVRGKKRLDVRQRRADKGHGAEMSHFTDAIANRQPLRITHEDGIRGTVCCLKIVESARQGRRLEIDPEDWQSVPGPTESDS